MQLIDPTVPLDRNPPVSPRHTPLSFARITRIAKGGRSNVSTLPPPQRGAATVRGGTTSIEGIDGPAPRVVLRKS